MQQITGLFMQAGDHRIPLRFRANPRARRLILRLSSDGSALVTLPRGVSLEDGKIFAENCSEWLQRQLARRVKTSQDGQSIPWRGRLEPLLIETVPQPGCNPAASIVRFGDATFKVRGSITDLRSVGELYMRKMAERELPTRLWALAAQKGFNANRVNIRNQRSRWGSCSRKGTISLNWRLIQCPSEVIDYVILHELAHLKHMNHSASFWMEVGRICPAYHCAEAWLKTTGKQWFHFD